MRILYLIHEFFPEYLTGTERFTLDLASLLQRAGHQVKVVTWSNGKHGFSRERHGLFLRDYSHQGVPVTAFRHKEPVPELHYGLDGDSPLRRLADEMLAPGLYDIIHVTHPMRVNPFIFSAIAKRIPYVLTMTDFFLICHQCNLRTVSHELCGGPMKGKTCVRDCRLPWMTPDSMVRRRAAAGVVLARAAAVTAPSRHMARAVRAEFPGTNVDIVRYGVSHSVLPEKERRYTGKSPITFGYLGSLSAIKGVHVLIKAFRGIQDERCRLKIYGPAVSREYLLDLLASAHGDPRISFCGAYESRIQLNGILDALDVTCVPSIWPDNYPLVIPEAHARGVPVIGSRIGAIPEAISDGVNGFLCAPDDSESLRRIMLKIVADPTLLNGVERNIIERSVKSVEEEALEYESLYRAAARRSDEVSIP